MTETPLTPEQLLAAKQALADFQLCDDINRREYAADIIMDHQATFAAALQHFAHPVAAEQADSQKVDEAVAWGVFYRSTNNLGWIEIKKDRAVESIGDSDYLYAAPLYTRPDGLTLELARALVTISNISMVSMTFEQCSDALKEECEKHATTIKMAEEIVKEESDAG